MTLDAVVIYLNWGIIIWRPILGSDPIAENQELESTNHTKSEVFKVYWKALL